MGKIVETRKLYKETINSITQTEENWLKFLDSISWHFKYDFADQILIYAQRPEARAVAEIQEWNEKVHRWVNKDAKFIFVLSKDENSQYPFRLVFDVADTHNYKGTPYKLWSIKPEYEKKIIETLETTFGGECESEDLAENIIANAHTMVTDNIQDYLSTIHEHKKGTVLENLSDNEIHDIAVLTVWSSVSYMMMTRCGINAREKIRIEEFSLIKNFNNDKIITALGTAISDIAEMGLRQIAKTVINLQNQQKNINYTFVKNQKQEYSNNKEIEKGGTKNGESRVQDDRRLSSTEFGNGKGGNTKWQIRKNEASLSKETQESRLFDIIDGQKLEQRINTNSRESDSDGATDSRKVSETRRDNRETERTRSDEMDRTNEQLQIDSRGTSNERTDIQLEQTENIAKELPTESEQKQNIAEVENTSVFSSFSQEEIDNVLTGGSGIVNGKFRIYEYLSRGLSKNENANFLKHEYGIGGASGNKDGISTWHDSKGLTLSRDNAPTLKLSWKQVEKRIRELIDIDRYFNEQQKDEYYDWLDANGITVNNTEKQIKDEDYKLAERLHNYLFNYDIVSYHNNFSLDNTTDQNIELLKADIDDEKNIKEYIDFLEGSYEDLDYDDEMSVEARALLVELERRLPYYEFNKGDIVYIATQQYEIRAVDNERVVLVDASFPILNKEMSREEFDKKVKENPANDKLRTGKRIEDKVKEESQNVIEQDESFNKWLDTFIEEKGIDLEETFTIEENGQLHIFELGNVIDNIKATSKEEQKAIKDMIVKIDFNNADVVDYFKHLAKALVKNYGQEIQPVNVQEQNNIKEQEKPKQEENLKANIKRKRKNKIEYFDLHPEIPLSERNNYKIQDDNLGVGTEKEKFRRNIEAIKVLKLCEEQNRYATPEEQNILSQYVGWGGLQQAFDNRIDSWKKEYDELKSLLTEKEYEEAYKSVVTAFYTPPIVIRTIYKALLNMGLEKGNILEPSCRSRKFYGYASRSSR